MRRQNRNVSRGRYLPQALTIATSDSGGGAGVQADIKAIAANGVYPLSVLVALTAQNTRGVSAVHALPVSFIHAQIAAVFDDFTIGAVKIGMLYSAEIVAAVAEDLHARRVANIVVDPVMTASTGAALLQETAVDALIQRLFPLALLVTPNVFEAERLAQMPIRTIDDARTAAKRIQALGPRAVLLKGGHLAASLATDLFYDGRRFTALHAEFIDRPNTHGTGCIYAAAVAAQIARGRSLLMAVRTAKRYVTEAIRHGLAIGHGAGPTNPLYFLKPPF